MTREGQRRTGRTASWATRLEDAGRRLAGAEIGIAAGLTSVDGSAVRGRGGAGQGVSVWVQGER